MSTYFHVSGAIITAVAKSVIVCVCYMVLLCLMCLSCYVFLSLVYYNAACKSL